MTDRPPKTLKTLGQDPYALYQLMGYEEAAQALRKEDPLVMTEAEVWEAWGAYQAWQAYGKIQSGDSAKVLGAYAIPPAWRLPEVMQRAFSSFPDSTPQPPPGIPPVPVIALFLAAYAVYEIHTLSQFTDFQQMLIDQGVTILPDARQICQQLCHQGIPGEGKERVEEYKDDLKVDWRTDLQEVGVPDYGEWVRWLKLEKHRQVVRGIEEEARRQNLPPGLVQYWIEEYLESVGLTYEELFSYRPLGVMGAQMSAGGKPEVDVIRQVTEESEEEPSLPSLSFAPHFHPDFIPLVVHLQRQERNFPVVIERVTRDEALNILTGAALREFLNAMSFGAIQGGEPFFLIARGVDGTVEGLAVYHLVWRGTQIFMRCDRRIKFDRNKITEVKWLGLALHAAALKYMKEHGYWYERDDILFSIALDPLNRFRERFPSPVRPWLPLVMIAPPDDGIDRKEGEYILSLFEGPDAPFTMTSLAPQQVEK